MRVQIHSVFVAGDSTLWNETTRGIVINGNKSVCIVGSASSFASQLSQQPIVDGERVHWFFKVQDQARLALIKLKLQRAAVAKLG